MSNPNSTIRSLRAAVSFLTVLPVANVDGSPGERLGRAYFPAIGAFIGLAAGAVFAVLSSVTTPLLAAAGGVAVLSVLTGAMHLDGLADTADGLLGGGDVTRRLESPPGRAGGGGGGPAVVGAPGGGSGGFPGGWFGCAGGGGWGWPSARGGGSCGGGWALFLFGRRLGECEGIEEPPTCRGCPT